MKKSQVAAALALAYVAGNVVAPVSNIYAEAVLSPKCDESVEASEDALMIITTDEINSILTGIRTLDNYNLYKNAWEIKTKYSVTVEYKGSEMTLAEAIDQSFTDTDLDFNNAKDAVDAANANIGNAGTLTNLATMVKDLMNEGRTPAEPYPTPSDFAALVDDAIEKVPFYEEYQELIRAVVSGKVSDIQTAARALNAARVNAGKDPEFAMTDDVLKNGASIEDIRASLGNASVHPTYIKQKRIFDLTYLQAGKLETLRAAKDNLATAETAAHEAEGKRNAAFDEVNLVFSDFKEAGVVVKNFKPRQTVHELVDLITGAYHNDQNNIVIEDYDLWNDFINYVELGVKDDDAQIAHATLEGYLSDSKIATEDEKNSIIDPVAKRKVCDVNGIVAVKGNLPLYHFAVEVNEVASDKFGFAEKIAYDITLSYKGEAYSIDSEVEVVINVPYYIDVETVEVFHVDGTQLEAMEIVERDNAEATITFKTTHFSEYALVGERKADESFGGHDDDDNFTKDDDFGGYDDDEGFTVTPEKPAVTVNPDPIESDETKLPAATTPNTGVVAKETATGKTNATVSIVAGMLAVAGAAIAAIVRFVRRDA